MTQEVKIISKQLDANRVMDIEYDIFKRFSNLATYRGECFVNKVKLEAAVRVWMVWANKVSF